MNTARIVLIVHNVRSAHNVGSLLRTADGMALEHVYLSGYSPYPRVPGDQRLPHMIERASKQIHKTALGAERTNCSHEKDLSALLVELKAQGFTILALEQTKDAKALSAYKTPAKVALLVGNEVEGLAKPILKLCDEFVEIAMLGSKESFNVTVAAAMALFQLRYHS